MRIMKDKAHFNSETSVYIGQLNKQCSEQDLIKEINQIFTYNKVYRKELEKWEAKEKGIKPKSVFPYFVLSCLVLAN